MADDYMDEDAETTGSPEDEGAPTGLLSKSFFMGKEKQPGDICSIEVVKVYDDQVEVKYIAHEGGEEDAMEEGMEEGAAAGMSAGMEDAEML